METSLFSTDSSPYYWVREYLGFLPQESDRMSWLITLAKEYHARTEAYDRTVCTGPIRYGEIMPATSQQFSLINRNALAVHRELSQKAFYLGFTAAEWSEAKRIALREIERQNNDT